MLIKPANQTRLYALILARLNSVEIATTDRLPAESKLLETEIPVAVYCQSRAMERRLHCMQRFRCPQCDIPSGDIRHRHELEIDLTD